jgi:hypothetical protein
MLQELAGLESPPRTLCYLALGGATPLCGDIAEAKVRCEDVERHVTDKRKIQTGMALENAITSGLQYAEITKLCRHSRFFVFLRTWGTTVLIIYLCCRKERFWDTQAENRARKRPTVRLGWPRPRVTGTEEGLCCHQS